MPSTAASVTTSCAAISRVDAGIATGRCVASGRHSAPNTSRSRRAGSGIGLASNSGSLHRAGLEAQPYPKAMEVSPRGSFPYTRDPPYGTGLDPAHTPAGPYSEDSTRSTFGTCDDRVHRRPRHCDPSAASTMPPMPSPSCCPWSWRCRRPVESMATGCSIVNAAMLTIRPYFHASGAALQLIVAGYTIAYASS